jgi:hypothetical protein
MVKAFPNPFMPSLGHSRVTISGLTPGTRVTIKTADGETVRELTAGDDGKAYWDGKDASGADVPSGVYVGDSENGPFKTAVQR